MVKERARETHMATIAIDNETATAVSPEGVKASMRVADLAAHLASVHLDTSDFVLPDGVKSVRSRGSVTILVHETPPQVFSFRWIANNSPRPFGPGTQYRTVRIALPYLITFAVYHRNRGRITLSNANECFFLNEPLQSLDGPRLMYPALLNCSRFDPPDGHPLAWICSQHLERSKFERETDTNKRMRAAFKELMRTLLATGFNYSSEHHEGASWYSETQKKRVDPRIMTIAKWESATSKDALFVLQVPWLKTALTVSQVMERIFRNLRAQGTTIRSANDMARVIFNQKSSTAGS